MSDTTNQTNTAAQNKSPAKRKLLSYLVVIGLVLVAMAYFNYIDSKDNAVNQNFYRVLYEASSKFNSKLLQLKRLHVNGVSLTGIRSFLPSYRIISGRIKLDGTEKYKYKLTADKIVVEVDQVDEYAQLQIEHLLPFPINGFSQYLFVNSDGEVLDSIGGEKSLSVTNLDDIKKALYKKNKSFEFNFSKTSTAKVTPELKLPSASTHVDMNVSYGKFRVFIFPFTPSIKLKQTASDLGNNVSTSHLYLVGLLPEKKLAQSNSDHWNISLLVVTITCLIFCWILLRLYLLPQHHVITKLNRFITQFFSHLFFIVLVALILAQMQKLNLQASKDKEAEKYLVSINDDLNDDLYTSFNGLRKHSSFYQNFYLGMREEFTPDSTEVAKNEDSSCEIGTQKIIDVTNIADIRTWPDVDKIEVGKIKKLLKESFEKLHETKQPTVASFCGALSTNPDNVDKKDILNEQLAINAFQSNKTGLRTLVILGEGLQSHINPTIPKFESFYTASSSSPKWLTSHWWLTNKCESCLNFLMPNFFNREYLQILIANLISGDDYIPNNMLSVFTMDKKGTVRMPSFGYRETNAVPRTMNLSHRNYFKQVRDKKAFNLRLKGSDYNNVYIQRLHNITDGSRGTTISMPLCGNHDCKKQMAFGSRKKQESLEELNGYVLSGDVLLSKLSLRKAPPQDFSYMIVDRNTGQVLFHNDESRTMVENFFYSSSNNGAVSNWVKGGLDSFTESDSDNKPMIKGSYHGQLGRYFVMPSKVDRWAVIVFYPNESLNTLMTNQFLYISASFIIAMLFLVIGFLAWCKLIDWSSHNKGLDCLTELIKKVSLFLPEPHQRVKYKKRLKRTSIYIACFYLLLFCLIQVSLKREYFYNMGLTVLSIVILFIVLGLVWTMFLWEKKKWVVPFLLLVFHCIYFYHTAFIPIQTLDSYYQKRGCSQVNLEQQELNNIGLMLFPNSITQHNLRAKELLLNPNISKFSCDNFSKDVLPEDLPRLSSLEGVKFYWTWAKQYLFNQKEDKNGSLEFAKEYELDYWVTFWSIFFFFLVIILWYFYHHLVLNGRLYCERRFLHHIKRLVHSSRRNNGRKDRSPSNRLVIDMESVNNECVELSWLIEKSATIPHYGKLDDLICNFKELNQIAHNIIPTSMKGVTLLNLKMYIEYPVKVNNNKLMNIYFSDMETCLDSEEARPVLLALILKLKALVQLGKIAKLTLLVGAHSLNKVETKTPFLEKSGKSINSKEYLKWAECLMAFKVITPKGIGKKLDKKLMGDEKGSFPELSNICEGNVNNPNFSEATINYILLHAEALYRYKWELCSSAEKLALYNLANGHRLNPRNTKLIENLAINGLLKVVEKDHLEIINKSFASFVLNAESEQTINQLVSYGEEGLWKQYRVPFAFLIVIVIGAIALTSGESIGIITTSLAGILVTIASVTNSANLLKGQLRS